MEALREAIEHNAIYRVAPGGQSLPGKAPNAWYKWQFYLRRVLLNPSLCSIAAQHLAQQLRNTVDLTNCQLAACEDAGVLIGYALAQETGLNLFTVKKSRKSYGLLNFTEGIVQDKPVILVDDVAGSTSTLKSAQRLLKHFNVPTVAYAVVINKDVAVHTSAYLDVPLVSCFDASMFNLTWQQYVDAHGKPPSYEFWH